MDIRQMYRELIIDSLILNFFDSFLTGMAAFSVCFFFAFFYRINMLVAVLITGVVFIRSLVKKIRENKILVLEHKYPSLKERLRTSFDYKDRYNTVINDLHSDIVAILKNVDVNAFLSGKKLIIKTFIILILLSTTLYFASAGIDVLHIKRAVVNSDIYRKVAGNLGILDETRDEVKDRPRLEDPRLIQLGNKDLNVSINSYNTELDIKDVTEPEKNDFGGSYPKEVAGAAQQIYDEKIPEEYKDVIKDYFSKINK